MAPTDLPFSIIVNNGDIIPGTDPGSDRLFNSYNQPSVNAEGVVVFRARSQGGTGQPDTGIFLGDIEGSSLEAIALRGSLVPEPNNTDATFNEFPSFPRIDRDSDMVAFRGQSNPVYVYEIPVDSAVDNALVAELLDGDSGDDEVEETRIGTSGVYSNPRGSLITGASQLGVPDLPEFEYFSVPGTDPSIRFDQFPGAPSPTDDLIVFKGNWVDDQEVGQTGVYFRDLVADAGESPVRFIADSRTEIPDVDEPVGADPVLFGSTAPPTAADGKMVFLGVDNEEDPEFGGIYLSDLAGDPTDLKTVVSLGDLTDLVGHEDGLTHIEEVISFDGRFMAWWGAWGDEDDVSQQLIACPEEGNPDRLAYCRDLAEDTGDEGDPYDEDGIGQGSDGHYYFLKSIPNHQGIFFTDTLTMQTELVARTGEEYDSFLFHNFSGRPPGVGEGHGGGEDVVNVTDDADGEEGDLELARWRESAFMASDGSDVAFKAAELMPFDLDEIGIETPDDLVGDVVIESSQGIYYQDLDSLTSAVAVVETGDDGGSLDPEAEGIPVVGLGLERDGLRFGQLVFSASMAAEEVVEELSPAVSALSQEVDSPPDDAHNDMGEEEEEIDTWAGIYSLVVNDDFNVVTGAGAGAGPDVRVFTAADGTNKDAFFAYDEAFRGGVDVSTGNVDVDVDGINDVITGAGAGAGPHVKVFSGASGEELRSFYAYGVGFAGGVHVGAGDTNNDGFDDVITGAGAGAGPHVKVFSGASGEELRSFYAYGAGFAGGVDVAGGDIDGDGFDDVITGAGAGAGPHVKVFSGATGEELRSFYAYEPGFGGGVRVASGDIDGDGYDDVITGAGAGAGPHVKAFSGASGEEILSFFAYDIGIGSGVDVAAVNADGDHYMEIATGVGPGSPPLTKVFNGMTGEELVEFNAYDQGFLGGVSLG